MSACEVGGDDRIPVGALHAHKQSIAGDAGVVDQDIDFPKLVYCCFNAGFDLIFAGDIHLEGRGFASGSFDLVYRFGQLFLIARGQGHFCAGLGQRNGAGAADALRRAGDERNMFFKL